ncbi:HAD-IA family hydrolase [Streptomyces sp. NPDC046988]|uniref:HAD family hydrolase n=1 Tax=Streptomyces sp. NPDC046988 TaxID=3154922 RepID=UPI0034086A0F
MRRTSRVALFDLDDTLTDHATAFASWAREFSRSEGIPLSMLMRAESLHAGARHSFFADLKDAFKLRRSIASLHADYRLRSAELVPYRPEVCAALQQLADDGWALGVVTNGSPDAQRLKLEVARLTPYFGSVVISGEYGVRKPDPSLFHVALDELQAQDTVASFMVGDSLTADVAGGQLAGLQTVWISHGRTRRLKGPVPTRTAHEVVSAATALRTLVSPLGAGALPQPVVTP